MKQINKPRERHPIGSALSPPTEFTPSEVEGPMANLPDRKAYRETRPKRPFLIATQTDSREESTRCKQKVIAISNRNKIHFLQAAFSSAHRSACEVRCQLPPFHS